MGAFASLKAPKSLLSRTPAAQNGSSAQPFASRSKKGAQVRTKTASVRRIGASIEWNRAERRDLAAPHILSSFAKPVYPHSDPLFRISAGKASERPPPPAGSAIALPLA
jgi:hypothetical protein